MNIVRACYARSAKILLAVSVCVLFVGAPEVVEAQTAGGGASGGRGGRGGDRPKPRTKQPQPADTDVPGHRSGKIVKFKPVKESEEDEEILGTLMVKPFEKGSKTIKLRVRRSEDLQIRVGDHMFDPEEELDIFWKGLHCTAGWNIADPDARRKIKELRRLTFDTIEVKGKIREIENELIVIKGVPKNGQNWPDLEAMRKDEQSNRFTKNKKKKRIRRRTLKLKVLEDVSKFYDSEKSEVDLEEFQADDEVEATVVVGKLGMMIALRHPVSAVEDEDTGRGRGGRPGPPRPRGGG